MAQDDFEGINRLERKLYSRKTVGLKGIKEHELKPHETSVDTEWKPPIPIQSPMTKKKKSWLAYFVAFSAIFFISAAGYAFYHFSGGGSTVSSRNIEIGIAGPVSMRGGDEIELDIVIRNKNSTALETGDLIVEFPSGTRTPGNTSEPLPRLRDGVGDIPAGGEAREKVSAVIFGEERSRQEILVTFEYRIPGSNAIFYKEVSYEVIISSSPLSLSVEGPVEANNGQEVVYTISVASNAPEAVQDVLLRVDYPPGFTFKSADPKPSGTTNVWQLGDLSSGSKKNVTIRGSLAGEDGDIRAFRFSAGTAEDQNLGDIAAAFAVNVKEVSIKRSFLGLSLAVNGEQNPTVSVKSGKAIRVDISYVNNLSTSITNGKISLRIIGEALDRSSVSAERGFYQSQNDTVVWDSTTLPELGTLVPGAKGVVSVTFSPKSLSQNITSLQNPEIMISLSASGIRSDGEGVPDTLQALIDRKIQIETDTDLLARVRYGAGPFTNSGSLPPQAEKETTYTVTWSIANGSNDITNAIVKAALPSYVRYVGTVSPTGQDVSFNAVGGVVTWRAGEVAAGTGFSKQPKEVSFQIAFIPSVSQIGSAPTLVNESVLTAEDRFTGAKITTTRPSLTTRLTQDPTFKTGDDQVVK